METFDILVEVFVLGNDSFSFVGEGGSTSKVVVVDECENDCSDGKVSNGQVVAGDKVFAVISENLVEIFDEGSQVLDVVGLFLFTKLLSTLVWIEFAYIVVSEVNSVVCYVSEFSVFGVGSVKFAEVTKNCA